MRKFLIAAGAIAVCGFAALTPVRADPVHDLGGPIRSGNMCWVSTNSDLGYGFWTECAEPEHMARRTKRMRS
jgi:hypothetical protein